MSETAKYRHLTVPYCTGNGLDIGSGGDPVVPWAIQVDLSAEAYQTYNQTARPATVQLACPIDRLPFKDNSLDFVYSSHLLEDFALDEWPRIVGEWTRVLKLGGHLVIVIPDSTRWKAALDRGQPPNCAHRHEGNVGELSAIVGGVIIRDSLTDLSPEDYSILFIARK